MKTISMKSRIGSDGVLKLKIPTDEKEVDVDVVIILQPNNIKTAWPKGFLRATYGCLKHDPIERLPQGNYTARNQLL